MTGRDVPPQALAGRESAARWAAKMLWRAVFGATPSVTAQRLGLRLYARKARRDVAYREWAARFAGPRLAGHYGHYSVEGPFALEHLKSQLYELMATLRRRLGPLPAGARVLDAGASDGLFLEALGARTGVGVNIIPACTVNIAKDGYRACLADIETLPFRARSFDVVLCCETLEHLPDPIQGLREMARVCRGRLCVSIPWVEATRITGPGAGGHRPDRQHVFEFNRKDFEAVAALAGLRTICYEMIRVFPGTRNPTLEFLFRQTIYCGYFPRLQYFELFPVWHENGRDALP